MQEREDGDAAAVEAALAALQDVPVAVISDALDALGLPNTVMESGVRLLSGQRILGRARTVERVRTPPNTTQPQVAAALGMGTQVLIDSCRPGDVIVIATGGETECGIWGDNMATRASALGVRGMVTDGAVRDLDEMEHLGVAIWARATSPRQATRRMLVLSIDKPVICAGVMVRPGDILAGDRDGVVVIAPEHLAAVAAKARDTIAVEERMQAFIREGNSLVKAVEIYRAR